MQLILTLRLLKVVFTRIVIFLKRQKTGDTIFSVASSVLYAYSSNNYYRINEDSPETASMHIQRDIEVGRDDDWHTSTRMEAVIRSDATTFYTDIKLTAKHNGEVVFERSYPSENPRFPEVEENQ